MTGFEYRQVRTVLLLTQAKLADDLGVSEAAVNRREAGKVEIVKETEYALMVMALKALGRPMSFEQLEVWVKNPVVVRGRETPLPPPMARPASNDSLRDWRSGNAPIPPPTQSQVDNNVDVGISRAERLVAFKREMQLTEHEEKRVRAYGWWPERCRGRVPEFVKVEGYDEPSET